MEEFYCNWEWQPIDNVPNGCIEIEVEFEDGTRGDMCSCDFWWRSDKVYPRIVRFRLK